jgi:hypothetical protein
MKIKRIKSTFNSCIPSKSNYDAPQSRDGPSIGKNLPSEANMADRLLVGVLGNRHSGKSYTWNTLFGRTVKRGIHPHKLELKSRECVEVFLVSGSFEERREYAGDILSNQNCRIVLCSMQYVEEVRETLDYLVKEDFNFYVQWLNPGHNDPGEVWDRLGLVNFILSQQSELSIRSGQGNAAARVQELREKIYGWPSYRRLILDR